MHVAVIMPVTTARRNENERCARERRARTARHIGAMTKELALAGHVLLPGAGSLVPSHALDAAHEVAGVGHHAVDLSAAEVEARVLLLEPIQQQLLLRCQLRRGVQLGVPAAG